MQKAETTPALTALVPGRLAYPINDFADAVGIGRSKIYEEIRDDRLQAKKLGSRTLIPVASAAAWLANLPSKVA